MASSPATKNVTTVTPSVAMDAPAAAKSKRAGSATPRNASPSNAATGLSLATNNAMTETTRSEERRVGKECRYRVVTVHRKKSKLHGEYQGQHTSVRRKKVR